MNTQEALKKIEKLDGLNIKDKDFNFAIEMIPKGEALEIVDQLDEPEKPVVPQFVADFYESIKDDFEDGVYGLCVQFNFDESELNDEVAGWFDHPKNKPIETLVLMYKFGYEVEKEKLYTVEIPNPNGDSNRYGLCKVDSRIIIGSFVFGLNKAVNTKLTESEIKQDFEWAWQFAKEVEE